MSAADCLDRHLYDEHFYASARPMAATSSPDGESPSHQGFPDDVAAIRPAGTGTDDLTAAVVALRPTAIGHPAGRTPRTGRHPR